MRIGLDNFALMRAAANAYVQRFDNGATPYVRLNQITIHDLRQSQANATLSGNPPNNAGKVQTDTDISMHLDMKG